MGPDKDQVVTGREATQQFSVTAEAIDVGRVEGFLGPSLPVWGDTGQTCDWSDPCRAVLDPSDRWTARVSDPLLSIPPP